MITIGGLISGCLNEDQSWGEKGELSLSIQLSEDTVGLNDTFHVDYEIRNVGNTSVRVLFPWWFVPPNLIIIRDDNGTIINCEVEWEPPPDPTDEDLVTLDPGVKISREIEITKDLFGFKANVTYGIRGKYVIRDYSTIKKPYWKGEIYSDLKYLSVIE